jgi:hypothetical protein
MEHECSDDPPLSGRDLKTMESSLSDPYIDLFDSDRIKAIVDQKLEQAMFEKVFFLIY